MQEHTETNVDKAPISFGGAQYVLEKKLEQDVHFVEHAKNKIESKQSNFEAAKEEVAESMGAAVSKVAAEEKGFLDVAKDMLTDYFTAVKEYLMTGTVKTEQPGSVSRPTSSSS